jgi:hypothetical protein
MDALGFLKPRRGYVMTGSYRDTPKSSPMWFDYSIVDRPSKGYSEIINNLITTREGLVIRTAWDCGFKPKGYVSTQDGQFWTIEQVQTDNNNNEALRFLAENPTAEFIIALIGVNNPKGLV